MPFSARGSIAVLCLVVFTCLLPDLAAAQIPPPRNPHDVRAFFTPFDGTTVIVAWMGGTVETDSVWLGYRGRRTIQGITPRPFELVGEYKAKDTVTSACLSTQQPCDLSQFVFYGRGLFFRGFRNNFLNGKYINNYPPQAPAVDCDTCWVFADQANLAGFTSQYAVTSIDTVRSFQSDSLESAIDTSVPVQPSTAPTTNP